MNLNRGRSGPEPGNRVLRVLGCLLACAMVAVGVTELGRGLEWVAHAMNVAGH